MRNKLYQKRGYSLIELMVAMFIFLTCLLFMIGMFPTAVKAVSQARHTFLATSIAQQELEYLKNLPWDKLENFQDYAQSEPDTFYRTTVLTSEINGVSSSVEFQTNPIISNYSTDPSGNVDVVNIRVLVKYAYGSSAVKDEYYKTVDMETLVAKPIK